MNAWDATIMVLVNLIIGAIVCVACGRIWIEARAVGGPPALLVRCGALQAVAVFSGVYAMLLVGPATLLGLAEPATLQATITWSGLPAILPLLGIGIIAAAETWRRAFRQRALAHLPPDDARELRRRHVFHRAEGPVSILADRVDEAFGDDGDRGTVLRAATILAASLAGASVLIPALVILLSMAAEPLPGDE